MTGTYVSPGEKKKGIEYKDEDGREEGRKKEEKNEFGSSCIHFINPDDLKSQPEVF